MDDHAKPAIFARTLRAVIAALAAGAAKFGRPAERQGVAGDRALAAPPVRGDLRHAGNGRRTALIGLGLGGCGESKRGQGDCGDRTGQLIPRFQRLPPNFVSATGSTPARTS